MSIANQAICTFFFYGLVGVTGKILWYNLDYLNVRWLWMLAVEQGFYPFFVLVLEPARYGFIISSSITSFYKIETTLIIFHSLKKVNIFCKVRIQLLT